MSLRASGVVTIVKARARCTKLAKNVLGDVSEKFFNRSGASCLVLANALQLTLTEDSGAELIRKTERSSSVCKKTTEA